MNVVNVEDYEIGCSVTRSVYVSVYTMTHIAPAEQAARPAVTLTSLLCSEAALLSFPCVYITSLGSEMHSHKRLLVFVCMLWLFPGFHFSRPFTRCALESWHRKSSLTVWRTIRSIRTMCETLHENLRSGIVCSLSSITEPCGTVRIVKVFIMLESLV